MSRHPSVPIPAFEARVLRPGLLALALAAASPLAMAAPADTDSLFSGGTAYFHIGTPCCFNNYQSLAMTPDGRFVLAGPTPNDLVGGWDWMLLRGTATGTLDTTLSGGTGWQQLGIGGGPPHKKRAMLNGVAVRADGSMLGVGDGLDASRTYETIHLVSWNADGTPDTSFSSDGQASTSFGADAIATAVSLQQDGKAVVAAMVYVAGTQQVAVLRYMTSGALDRHFGTSGVFGMSGAIAGTKGYPGSVTVQPDGMILVSFFEDAQHLKVLRLTSTGVPDTGFGTGGVATFPFSNIALTKFRLFVQPDGAIVGTANTGLDHSWVYRLLPNGSLDTTFNGQGWIDLNIDVGV